MFGREMPGQFATIGQTNRMKVWLALFLIKVKLPDNPLVV